MGALPACGKSKREVREKREKVKLKEDRNKVLCDW
jgi:hypothetical protein